MFTPRSRSFIPLIVQPVYSYHCLRSQATRNQQSARSRAELLSGDRVSPTASPQLALDDSALDATHALSRTKKAATIDARYHRGHQQSSAATPATGAGALGASDKSTVGDTDEAELSSPAAGSNLRRSHSAARSRPSQSGAGGQHGGGGRVAGLVSKLGLGGGRSSVRESRSNARSRERRNDDDAPAGASAASASASATGPSASGVSFTLEESACGARGVPLFLEQIFEYIEMHGVHFEARFRLGLFGLLGRAALPRAILRTYEHLHE